MDGYPKDYENAKDVFIITPKAPEKKAPVEGEEEAEEPPADDEENKLKPVLQTNIYPESVISLQASEQFIKRRCKNL